MESHQSLEEDDVSRTNVGRFLQSCMFDKRVLWDADSIIALDEINKSLVGEVEVKGVGMVEVVLGNIDLCLVHTCVA